MEEKRYKIWVEEGIVFIDIGQIESNEELFGLMDEAEELLQKKTTKGRFLVRVEPKMNYKGVSSEWRKRIMERLKKVYKEVGFEKAALYGINSMIKTIMVFVINAAGLQDIVRAFASKEEALKWLEE